MVTVTTASLKKDMTFSGDLFIDNTFLLLPKTAEVNDDMIKALNTWGFENLLCEGSLSLGGDIGIESSTDDDFSEQAPKEKINLNVKKIIEDSKHSATYNNDIDRMNMVREVYNEYMNYIESVFTHFVTHKEINQNELSETVQDLVIFIKEHKRYILRINPTLDANKKNFLVLHSMRCTVVALAIGLQLHLPLSKMIDLGVTCIIHEIGMLRLPPQLYMTPKRLTANERAQVSKHTLFGYTITKDLNFPLSIQLGVLEHHENENGTGYPRHITGDKITSIAKIISVACSYEAISSPRSYKDERSTFEALLEMLQNKEKKYDDAIIKALLYTVSLYPIGTYVYLSDKKVAEVVDSTPGDPRCPYVQYLTERDEHGAQKVILTGAKSGITVLRILTKQEQQDAMRIIAEKNKAISPAAVTAVSQTGTSQTITDIPQTGTSQTGTDITQTEKLAQQSVKNAQTENQSVSELEEIDINTFN